MEYCNLKQMVSKQRIYDQYTQENDGIYVHILT